MGNNSLTLKWQFCEIKPKPALESRVGQVDGQFVRIPRKEALPQRHSFSASTDATADSDMVEALSQYLIKACQTIQSYYLDRNASAVPSVTNVDHIAADNGWNRLVFVIDDVYGKITTNLWRGGDRPSSVDRVWVIINFNSFAPDRNKGSESNDLQDNRRDFYNTVKPLLFEASMSSLVKESFKQIAKWRNCTFWTINSDIEGGLEPLPTS